MTGAVQVQVWEEGHIPGLGAVWRGPQVGTSGGAAQEVGERYAARDKMNKVKEMRWWVAKSGGSSSKDIKVKETSE